MKNYTALGFLLFSASTLAQPSPGSQGHGAPNFVCAVNDNYQDVDTQIVWQCFAGNTWKPTPQFQPYGGPVATPQLTVSKTFTVTPQTIRGIVAAFAGQSTSNGGTYMDIFPVGYNPWVSGITFEDYATNLSGAAITLGLADDNGNSQRICFYGGRAATFDNFSCLQAHGAALNWTGSIVLGTSPSSESEAQFSFGARVGFDSTNQNAVLNGGGSTTSASVGAALAVASANLGTTYAILCDHTGTCGVGAQKQNATLDNWFVTPAGAQTTVSIKVGTGNVLARYYRFAGAFSPSPVAANTCAAQSFTVTGVVVGDILIGVNKPTEQAGLSISPGHVTAANTATINFCNNTAASITPTGSETYNLVVVQ